MVTIDLGTGFITRRCTRMGGWEPLQEWALVEFFSEYHPGVIGAVFELAIIHNSHVEIRAELSPSLSDYYVDDVARFAHSVKLVMDDATAVLWRMNDEWVWPGK